MSSTDTHEPVNDLDFGSGFTGRWVGWHPDRDLNPQYPIDEFPDSDRAVLMLKCPHGEGGIPINGETPSRQGNEGWTVQSWEPLTLTPSIRRRTECGCHGFITDGKWVPA
jgi:hypothetical protein